jgi:hypothetical protein
MSHLSPTHREISKRDSPHEHIGVKQLKYPGFKFKPWHVNDSSQSNQCTDHLVSQSPLDEYIDNKSTKFEFWIQDTWSTARRPKSHRKAEEDHLEEGEATKPTSGTKSGKTKERVKKSSNSKLLK